MGDKEGGFGQVANEAMQNMYGDQGQKKSRFAPTEAQGQGQQPMGPPTQADGQGQVGQNYFPQPQGQQMQQQPPPNQQQYDPNAMGQQGGYYNNAQMAQSVNLDPNQQQYGQGGYDPYQQQGQYGYDPYQDPYGQQSFDQQGGYGDDGMGQFGGMGMGMMPPPLGMMGYGQDDDDDDDDDEDDEEEDEEDYQATRKANQQIREMKLVEALDKQTNLLEQIALNYQKNKEVRNKGELRKLKNKLERLENEKLFKDLQLHQTKIANEIAQQNNQVIYNHLNAQAQLRANPLILSVPDSEPGSQQGGGFGGGGNDNNIKMIPLLKNGGGGESRSVSSRNSTKKNIHFPFSQINPMRSPMGMNSMPNLFGGGMKMGMNPMMMKMNRYQNMLGGSQGNIFQPGGGKHPMFGMGGMQQPSFLPPINLPPINPNFMQQDKHKKHKKHHHHHHKHEDKDNSQSKKLHKPKIKEIDIDIDSFLKNRNNSSKGSK